MKPVEPDFFDASLMSHGNGSMFEVPKKTSGTFNNASEFTKPSGDSPANRRNSYITSDINKSNNITIDEGQIEN